jgi:hypothetical protein
MSARFAIAAVALVVAGCGGSPQAVGSAQTSVPSAASAPPSSASAPSASPSIAVGSAPAPPATTAPGEGKFTVCPTAATGPLCPLPPGAYTAAVHDVFSFSVPEAGWQEERAVAGEFDTRVVLSRVDAPDQRVSFLSGPTGLASPVAIDPAAFTIPGFKAGQPTDVKIASTSAEFIDLEPAGAQAASSVTIENQSIRIEPDRKYRFTVAKIPMDQEAATVIMVTEAPVDAFATFVVLADRILQTVKFS